MATPVLVRPARCWLSGRTWCTWSAYRLRRSGRRRGTSGRYARLGRRRGWRGTPTTRRTTRATRIPPRRRRASGCSTRAPRSSLAQYGRSRRIARRRVSSSSSTLTPNGPRCSGQGGCCLLRAGRARRHPTSVSAGSIGMMGTPHLQQLQRYVDALNPMQRYLVTEFVDNYEDGLMSRRDLLERVYRITGSVAAAAGTLLALGCAPATATQAP